MLVTMLVAVPLLLTGCSSGDVDAWKRGALPEGVTNHTDRITTLWQGAWIAALGIGVLVWGLIFWAIIAFRRKPGEVGVPAQVRYNLPVEVTFTVVPLIMVLVYFFFTARDEDAILKVSENPQQTVSVVGHRWGWDFNYLAPDGKPQVYDTGNQVNPPTMYLPINQSVKFLLNTRDVNHSFWVPAFQFKMDLIAGRTNEFEIKPVVLGTFRGKCAELCGVDHSRMLFQVKVVTAAQYQAHLDGLARLGQTGELAPNLGKDVIGTQDAPPSGEGIG